MTDTVDKIIIQSSTQGVTQTTNEVQGLSKAMDGVTVASQSVERSTTSVEGKFSALERRLSTTAGQAAQLEKIQKTVNTAVAQNPALQERANAVLAAAESRYAGASKGAEAVAKSTGLAGYQLLNLSRQLQDVGVQLVGGASPFMVLAQQGPQVVDIFQQGNVTARGFFEQLTSGAARVLTPMRLLVGGVVGIGAAALYLKSSWDEARSEVDQALIGIGQRTGTTAQEISNFTKANSSAAGLSVAQAREVALEFTKTGNVQIAALKGVGDAIRGYSLLTGKDASEATKTFADAISGDLVKGIESIDQRYGALNARSIEYIKTLVDQGEKTKALQVYIDAIAPANQRAAESVGVLSKAWQAFKNVASDIANGPAPSSLQDQLKSLQERRSQAQAGGSLGASMFGGLAGVSAEIPGLAELDQQIAEVQRKLSEFDASNATAQLNAISKKAYDATNAILPQIDAMRQLEQAIRSIQDAQAAGVGPSNADAALTVLQYQLNLQQESLQMMVQQAQAVQGIKAAWGDVSSQTAVALNNLQSQLQVSQQVTAAGQMKQQAEATYVQLLAQGVSALEAQAIAAKQLEVAQASATTQVMRQVQSLKDQNAMIKAGENGTKAQTAAAIAYRNAMDAGASETAAAALRAETLKNEMLQAQSAGSGFASSMRSAADAMGDAARTQFIRDQMGNTGADQRYTTDYDSGSFSGGDDLSARGRLGGSYTDYGYAAMSNYRLYQQAAANAMNLSESVSQVFTSGGVDAALSYVTGQSARGNTIPSVSGPFGQSKFSDFGLSDPITAKAISESEIISQVGSLYDLKNMGADKSTQLANMNSELAWLQSRSPSIEQQRAILDLKRSIEQLTNSTDELAGTNRDLLSPYYSQDPRTSKIGFRSQGMASGGYVDVPGAPSANDNMLAIIPVASGERIYVDPMPSKRGGGGTTIVNNISVPVTVVGNASRDEVGRTGRQLSEMIAKRLAAVQ